MMADKYLYLLLDILAISIPLIASFYPKAPFYRHWKYIFMAIVLPGGWFLIWDIFFTKWQVWGFNERYLTGISWNGLPLEEWLFFLCVPYACLFTYFALNHLIKKNPFEKIARPLSWLLVGSLIIIGIINLDKWYTSTTFLSLAVFLLLHLLIWKSPYLGKFYFTFMVILVPFLIINGILTGTGIEEPIVWYNDTMNLGLRIGTIPLEDIFYGMLLVLLNVTWYERQRLAANIS